MEEWEDFHRRGNANPAVVDQCATGGRLLHWLGYRDRDRDRAVSRREDFLHVGSNESLMIDAWRPSQPNGKKDQCIIAYLGNEPAESWLVS
jgi:hypothetical protein